MTSTKKILVTGAGGPAGIAVINELNRLGHETLGCDSNPYAAGIRLASQGEIVPRFDSPDYIQGLVALARSKDVDGLISTMTEEMSVLTRPENLEILDEAELSYWFPSKSCIDTCMDKRIFAKVTEEAGQPVPLTGSGPVSDALDKVPGPWIIKPCFGRGSRDVFAVDGESEVREIWSRVPEPILQTRLEGAEFTLDALVDRDGSLLGGVPRFRLETKAGISTVGQTFESPELLELTESLLRSIGHTGPANVQGFIDLKTGDFGFMEVNPRFSGALPLSLGSGADLVGQYVTGMFGESIDRDALSFEPGTVMVRYFQETFFNEAAPDIPKLKLVR